MPSLWTDITDFVDQQMGIGVGFFITYVIAKFLTKQMKSRTDKYPVFLTNLIHYGLLILVGLYFKAKQIHKDCKGENIGFDIGRGLIESILAVCVTDILVMATSSLGPISMFIKGFEKIPYVGGAFIWVGHYIIFGVSYKLLLELLSTISSSTKNKAYCSSVTGNEIIFSMATLILALLLNKTDCLNRPDDLYYDEDEYSG